MNDKKLTPEIARKAEEQIKERMGTEPLEITVNGGKSDIYWDQIAELWVCRTCKKAWLRMAISRCQCEDAPLICFQDGVN